MNNFTGIAEFYKGKSVLLTGHTGFKGSWMCAVLSMFGAKVTGYALEEPTVPGLFSILKIGKETLSKSDEAETISADENAIEGDEIRVKNAEGIFDGISDDFNNVLAARGGISDFSNVRSVIGDIRDLDHLKQVFAETQPDIVIHMAAQPIVRESYRDPVGTYETNVMGTVNLLECCRLTPSVKSVVNVTTDKVYRNNEWDRGYVETDYLDGYDPYSNSKSCSELVTHSYIQSFFSSDDVSTISGIPNRRIAVSTCRAGNVIGGGDFAMDRIIPDCVRAVKNGEDIVVRNPYSTRPYQHVLEPIFAYLMVAMKQYEDSNYASNYNVGPEDESCVTTGELVTKFCDCWNNLSGVNHKMNVDPEMAGCGSANKTACVSDTDYNVNKPCEASKSVSKYDNDVKKVTWINRHDGGPHEANFLKLDCTKIKNTFGWAPAWNIDTTMEKLVEWYSIYLSGGDVIECTKKQIKEYMECLKA